MMTRTFAGIVLVVVLLGMSTPAASGQTPIQGGFEIRLLPGFAHEPLQGIDSIVGKIGKKDGLQIQYEIGNIPKGGLATGGSFVNQALRVPEKDRVWLKEQDAGGRKIHVAYTKENHLIISSASTKEGVNFHCVAKTSGEVADVLLMVLTFAEQKPKRN